MQTGCLAVHFVTLQVDSALVNILVVVVQLLLYL